MRRGGGRVLHRVCEWNGEKDVARPYAIEAACAVGSGEEDGGGTSVAVEEERVEYITSLMRAGNESALWFRV